MYLNNSNTVSSFKGYLKEPEISPLRLCLENVHRTLQRSVNINYTVCALAFVISVLDFESSHHFLVTTVIALINPFS